MKRLSLIGLALLATWLSFGLTMYAWLDTLDQHCSKFIARGLSAECVAPVGPLMISITAVFVIASCTLAYAAVRNRVGRS